MDNLSGVHVETVIVVMVMLRWLDVVEGEGGYWIDLQVKLGP